MGAIFWDRCDTPGMALEGKCGTGSREDTAGMAREGKRGDCSGSREDFR